MKFGLTLDSLREAQDVVARFETQTVGPMRTPYAEVVASSVGQLIGLDRSTTVEYSPITGIDVVSNRPNPNDVQHRLVIDTPVAQDVARGIVQANYDQLREAVGSEY